MHEFWRRIREHSRKIGVGDFGKDGDITRVFLAENRNRFGQQGREDTQFDEGMHAV